MKEKSIEDTIKEMISSLEKIESPEERKKEIEIINMLLDILEMNLEQLRNGKQNLLKDNLMDNALKEKLINFIDDVIDDKMKFLEEGSKLQQREEKLSSLEAEEQTISKAESLIDQQRPGQNIGEE